MSLALVSLSFWHAQILIPVRGFWEPLLFEFILSYFFLLIPTSSPKIRYPINIYLSSKCIWILIWSFKHSKKCKPSSCARGVMAIVVGNRHADPNLNPGRGCLHFTWGRYERKTYSPAMGKIVGQNELLSLDMATALGEGKFWMLKY